MHLALDQTMSCSHHSRTDLAAESEARVTWSAAECVALSVILPAYNEAQRLPAFLDAIRPYCVQRFGEDYEVIVVDDGSSDGLSDRIVAWSPQWSQLKSLRLAEHRGKGAAVRGHAGRARTAAAVRRCGWGYPDC